MKRIQSVALKNFRGIREGEVDGLVDVNVIVGKNNSGKSTLVEALARSADLVSGRADDLLGRNRSDAAGSQRGGGASANAVQFRGKEAGTVTIRSSDLVEITTEFGSSGWVTSRQAAGALTGLAVFYPSDSRNVAIENHLWRATLAERRDKTLAAALSDIFGMDLEGVALPPDGHAVLLFRDYGLPLDAQGDGARAAFRALTMLGAMKDAPFILEEPECHQHPGSLRRFALAVVKLAKTNGVQLFITTHSGECVAAFLDASKEAQSEAAVFHFALSDGAFEARKLDTHTAETLAATGTDVRFLSLYA